VVCLAVPVLLLVALCALYAPGYLFTSDVPRKADVVVLFVGPDRVARLDEAKQLIKDGYARYLLIPASGELYAAEAAGRLVWKDTVIQPQVGFYPTKRIVAGYGKFHENTHIEALEAKRMMDERGLRSALLVSSPYHLRRIRLLAGRVFDARDYSISCIPARWPAPFTAADWLNGEHRRIIVKEYLKIGWFLAYGVVGSRQHEKLP
jgi:uncharacterized SAM-binding protein YcdF (DUF218 family)